MAPRMRILFCLTVWLLLVGVTTADERDAKIDKLNRRVATLEAENEKLRRRLAQIATLSTEVDVQPSASLAITLASENWGAAQPADILKVLQSSAHPLWQSAGKPPLHAIGVVKDPEGPRVNYRRGTGDTYVVLLDVDGRLWAKFSYQFSHEMCHILSNYRDVPNPQMWLEESLCECASLYSLQAMGRSWKKVPPYPNWKSYADSLTSYASDRIGEAQDVPSGNLAKWYEQNKSTLEEVSTNRDLNLVVAVKLLEIFEQHPNSWRVTRSLNEGEPSENLSLHRYLVGWHSRVDEVDQIVVEQIAELFGVILDQR